MASERHFVILLERLLALLCTFGNIESLCGADQLCDGVKSRIEGAIHVMNEMYSQNCTSDDQDVLLVDASNPFNSLNHAALL